MCLGLKFLHLSSIFGRKDSHEPEAMPRVTSLGRRQNAAVRTLVRLTPDTTGRRSHFSQNSSIPVGTAPILYPSGEPHVSWLFLGPILTGVVTGFPPKGSLKFSLSLKVSCDTSLRNGPSNVALLESFSSWHHQVRSYKLILKSTYFALESYQDSQHLSIFHFKGPATHSLSFISTSTSSVPANVEPYTRCLREDRGTPYFMEVAACIQMPNDPQSLQSLVQRAWTWGCGEQD